jgi:hypothetical protein
VNDYLGIGNLIFTGAFFVWVLNNGGWFNWLGLIANIFASVSFISRLIERGVLP